MASVRIATFSELDPARPAGAPLEPLEAFSMTNRLTALLARTVIVAALVTAGTTSADEQTDHTETQNTATEQMQGNGSALFPDMWTLIEALLDSNE